MASSEVSSPANAVAFRDSIHDPLLDPLLLREWFAVGWSSEVVPGALLARRALGRDVVLWRSGDGEAHCWLDLCVHRGAKLSLGRVERSRFPSGMTERKARAEADSVTGRTDRKAEEADSLIGIGERNRSDADEDCLVCPYHGWRYGESGQCVGIPAQPGLAPPAKARAEVFEVCERFGAIWVCFGAGRGAGAGAMPEFPAAEDASFRMMAAGPYRFRALGPRLIENFLDVAHLGIVHEGLLGDPARAQIEDYAVEAGARGPLGREIRVWQPDPEGTGAGAMVTYEYEVQGPLTASFVKLHGENRLAILAQVMPVDGEWSEMRMVLAMNYGHEIPEAELVAFQDHVAAQDRRIVESQRPELLPLDLQAELHLRSDRMAIAYRKWLREIGFSYGVV